MNKSLHTPGPWYARHSPLVRVYPRGGIKPVCGIHRNRAADNREAFANANLIAAAPEMYESLKLARNVILEDPEHAVLLSKIDEALAKAEGEK